MSREIYLMPTIRHLVNDVFKINMSIYT